MHRRPNRNTNPKPEVDVVKPEVDVVKPEPEDLDVVDLDFVGLALDFDVVVGLDFVASKGLGLVASTKDGSALP